MLPGEKREIPLSRPVGIAGLPAFQNENCTILSHNDVNGRYDSSTLEIRKFNGSSGRAAVPSRTSIINLSVVGTAGDPRLYRGKLAALPGENDHAAPK